MSLLAHVTEEDFLTQPVPHVVVRDVIDADYCRELLRHFPPLATIVGGRVVGSNEPYNYSIKHALQKHEISECWIDFLIKHVSQSFLADLIRLLVLTFGRCIHSLRSVTLRSTNYVQASAASIHSMRSMY